MIIYLPILPFVTPHLLRGLGLHIATEYLIPDPGIRRDDSIGMSDSMGMGGKNAS